MGRPMYPCIHEHTYPCIHVPMRIYVYSSSSLLQEEVGDILLVQKNIHNAIIKQDQPFRVIQLGKYERKQDKHFNNKCINTSIARKTLREE